MKEKGVADEIVALTCGPPKSEVFLPNASPFHVIYLI